MADFRKNKPKNAGAASIAISIPEDVTDTQTTQADQSEQPIEVVQVTQPDKPAFQSISREEVILRRMFDDSVIQNKLLKHLDPDLFEDDIHKSLCTAIIKTHKKYGKFPQAEELSIALPDNSAEKSRLTKIMNLKVKNIERDVVIDVIENYFREKKTENILGNAAEAIHDKNFADISSMILELQEAVNFSLYIDIGLNLVEDVDEALRRLNDTHKPIPSALKDIREWTMQGEGVGGWYRGLSVFMGMPNVGKTIFLCNEAAFSFQNGYNVLYVTLEMEEALIWERIAVNITDIPLNKIRGSDGKNVKQLLKERKIGVNSNQGELYVRELDSTTTATDIENLINEIKMSDGITIDICFIDYIQIMKPIIRKGSINNKNGSLYSFGKETAEQLRDLSRKQQMPIVTASQLNRDGYSNTSADMKNTAGSAGLNDTADFIVTITSDPFLEKYGMFLHTIIKNRFGPKMITFVTECDIMHMRVRSASNEMRKKYSESQINETIQISNFNRKPNESAGEKVEKEKSVIDAEKKEEETNRFNKIRQDVIKKEREKNKNILKNDEEASENHILDAKDTTDSIIEAEFTPVKKANFLDMARKRKDGIESGNT